MAFENTHLTDSSDEEEVDILFRFPQLENAQDTFDICEKPIEIHGLLGQPLPTCTKTLSHETESACNSPQEPLEQDGNGKHVKFNENYIYLRMGDLLFRGEWKDFRYIQLNKRSTLMSSTQEPLGTKVMIELPSTEKDTNESFRAIPINPDDVHTAVFQRILLTDQEIGEIRDAELDSE